MNIILASQSQPRMALLKRLGLNFRAIPANINESVLPDETVENLVTRLARAKAVKIAEQYPDSLIIAADEVASVAGNIFGKPGNAARAYEQLRAASGRTMQFHTGLHVCCLAKEQQFNYLETFEITFKVLSDELIHYYIKHDQPFECAGSIKAESLGALLFERMSGKDFTTVLGLPMIALGNLLIDLGIIQLSDNVS